MTRSVRSKKTLLFMDSEAFLEWTDWDTFTSSLGLQTGVCVSALPISYHPSTPHQLFILNSVSTTKMAGPTSRDREEMVRGLYKEWPWGPGTRRDGIYYVPGEHVYDGMVFPAVMLDSELARVKNSLDFNENDVISAGSPKTGRTRNTPICILHLIICIFIHIHIRQSVEYLFIYW